MRLLCKGAEETSYISSNVLEASCRKISFSQYMVVHCDYAAVLICRSQLTIGSGLGGGGSMGKIRVKCGSHYHLLLVNHSQYRESEYHEKAGGAK